MSATASGIVRALAAAMLTALSPAWPPSAHAVAPPPVDDRWLPAPATPAPARPTVQREVCSALTAGSGPATDRGGMPAQLGDLSQVWQLTRGAGQRVAVIDTGVSRHERLPNVVAGGDYVSTGDGTQDCDAHGTAVAGIIAATTDSGPKTAGGVAPDVTLISIRQSSTKFGSAGDRSGAGAGDVDTMAKAVRTAADLGASVINISSVACVPVADGLDDRALGAALAYAVDVKNAVIVAAAGNTDGAAHCPPQRSDATWDTVTVAVSPAWYDDYVLTVGSVNAEGAPSTFTLAGPWVDVAAVGEAVTSLGSVPLSGTSYAAPVVSGLAALIRSRFPALTARQVIARIESTAHHPPAGWDLLVGNGIVDALAAVSTDTPQPVTPTAPGEVSVSTIPAPTPPGRPGSATAFGGAALCLVAVLVILATSRLRRPGSDGVAGD